MHNFHQETDDHVNDGVDYMCQAAEVGDRSAMVFMAKAFETGACLGTKRWGLLKIL